MKLICFWSSYLTTATFAHSEGFLKKTAILEAYLNSRFDTCSINSLITKIVNANEWFAHTCM